MSFVSSVQSYIQPFASAAQELILGKEDPLYEAINSNEKRKVKDLIIENPQLLSEPMRNGDLPFNYAIKIGRDKIARKLFKFGSNPSLRGSQNFNAFEYAFLAGKTHIVEKILNNINKDTPWISKRTESLRKQLEAVKQEFQKENPEALNEDQLRKLNMPDENGITDIEKSITTENAAIFAILIISGADLNIRTKEGESLLHLAARINNPLILHLLLEAGLDPNQTNQKGVTPLHFATVLQNDYMQHLLIAYGADFKRKSLLQNVPSPLELMAKIAAARDPLQVNKGDSLLFLTTVAYWLSLGFVYCDPMGVVEQIPFNLPFAVNTLTALTSLAYFGPKVENWWKKGASFALFSALNYNPVFNLSFNLIRMYDTTMRAFEGIKQSYSYYSLNPLKAFEKVTVHAVNSASSMHDFYQSIGILSDIFTQKQEELLKRFREKEMRLKQEADYCGKELDYTVCKEARNLEERLACASKKLDLKPAVCEKHADYILPKVAVNAYKKLSISCKKQDDLCQAYLNQAYEFRTNLQESKSIVQYTAGAWNNLNASLWQRVNSLFSWGEENKSALVKTFN